MAVHELRDLTWPAFAAIDKKNAVAVLPLGAIEAHGPHLPLGTDIVIAEAMARAGAQRLADGGFEVLLLPAIPVAPAPFAAAFEGTLDTPGSATTAIVTGIARSLARAGVSTLAIANAHHDPAHVQAIRDAGSKDTDAAAIVFPDLTRRKWAERLTDEFRSGACHAGRYEGSIVLAAEPALVDTARLGGLRPNPRSLVDAIARGKTTFAAAGGPEAYFGWPSEASAAEGREIIDRLGALLADAVAAHMGNEERGTGNEERRTKNEERGTKNEERRTQSQDRAAGGDSRDLDGSLLPVNPESLGRPVGFSHGMVAPAGSRMLYVAGQTATDASGAIADRRFAAQFAIALDRVLAVVRAAGGAPADIARMTIYVTDLDAYRASRPDIGAAWTARMGKHYPAMALVEVKGLVDREAMVEIEADAVLPPARARDERTDSA